MSLVGGQAPLGIPREQAFWASGGQGRRRVLPDDDLQRFTKESGEDEYQGDQSDTEDKVDSDFDTDDGDEPASDGETEEPRKKHQVVTKAYKESLESLRP
ncbi:Vacuolar protein sorting-associated protein 72-like protein [Sciurus carolinensis]|uniref:Vacuolar protein sorting-associated protein 72-like protein n=1 Tax=Sciurus carolinensis TaxID=30640 RepID=A0AA41N066_SCICA|nr:Vacuolar protein sorting-associated protein 72-like protein [Sciurus carolinensis]MBZ3885223.1 Vacuolar protein sorting-associated protein 72-like protein [Sciurus carolinensis]